MKLKLALIIAIGGLLVACGLAIRASAEPGYSVTVTAMQKVAPDRGTILNGKTFTTGATNVAGDVVSNSAGRLYMALNTGTNGAALTHTSGTAASGSITYYRVQETKRRGIYITNAGSDPLAVGIGASPESVTAGIILSSNETVKIDGDVQDAIYAGTNSIVAVQEY